MSTSDVTRRDFMKTAGLGATAATFSACATTTERTAREVSVKKPNIIFILVDDLGYGDLGCYGQEKIQTPSLDRMCREGIKFTDCYAGSTVCAPSRSVLMTGQHTGHTRVRGNKGKVGGVPPQGRVPLKPEDVTVAEVLRQAGYVTGITGKWGLGEPDTTGVPNRQGFDEWLGYLNQQWAHSYYREYIWRNEEKLLLEGNLDGKHEQYTHDMFTEFALDFIRNNHQQPFFLYLAWCIPHDRLAVPSLEPYTGKDWPDDPKAYAAMVTRMDTHVGRIMALLEELAIDQKTIVFFASDNGAARRWEGMFDSSGPLRGNKRDMYEGGLRTPMIVRWPGVIPAGPVSEEVWYFADFLPTAAALAGIKPPPNIDGVNVLPAILGKKQNLKDRFLYWEFYERGFNQAVRWRDWKAIRMKPGTPLQLYNLAEDIGEQNDVADQHPDVVGIIEGYLETARFDSPNWPID